MTESNDRYKRQKPTRKTGTVKHVTLSEETKRAYEELLKAREEKQMAYGRYLDPDNKTR